MVEAGQRPHRADAEERQIVEDRTPVDLDLRARAVGDRQPLGGPLVDQAARQEATLPKGIVAILAAHAAGLLADIEGLGSLAGEELHRLVIEIGVGLHLVMREIVLEGGSELAGQLNPLVHALLVDFREQVLDPFL